MCWVPPRLGSKRKAFQMPRPQRTAGARGHDRSGMPTSRHPDRIGATKDGLGDVASHEWLATNATARLASAAPSLGSPAVTRMLAAPIPHTQQAYLGNVPTMQCRSELQMG